MSGLTGRGQPRRRDWWGQGGGPWAPSDWSINHQPYGTGYQTGGEGDDNFYFNIHMRIW